MVRLKETIILSEASGMTYFNSTMVRLKAGAGDLNINTLSDFNSTMVRLKAGNRNSLLC